MRKAKKVLAISILTVLIVAGLIVWFIHTRVFNENNNGGISLSQTMPVVINPSALSLQNDVVQVVKKLKPAVVEITTEKTVTYRYWNPFGNLGNQGLNGFFGNFFGQSAPNQQQQQQPKTLTRKEEYLGSGFIVEKDGYILTNNHVVAGMDKIFVRLFGNDTKYPAKVIGTDPQTDLALIKINAGDNLPTVSLGNSDSLNVGDFVIAIGNPMGLSESVTFGIVSAKGRYVSGMPLQESFIQTDAAINPGNSGGPLVNLEGQVIGINTFIISPDIATNLGFAIPINTAKRIFIQLKEHGKVIRGFLGVFLQSLTHKLATSFGLSSKRGALVASVIPGTPAEKSGIQSGDIILDFNGKPIKNIMELENDVSNAKVGEIITLTIWRDKKEISIPIKIEERPSEKELSLESQYASGEATWRGMTVENLTKAMKQNYNIPDNINGVIVSAVESNSPADQEGITPGAVITKIEGNQISNINNFQEVISKIGEKQTTNVLIYVNGQSQWFAIIGK